ncbi:MAG: 50S ribosomal protein L19 [Elusimicrobiota bacterium]
MINKIRQQLKKNIPDFKPGDEVRVDMKVGQDKRRIQSFQGLVISEKGKGINKTFTVRKYSFGIGVEKVFPLHSPLITKIKVIRRGKVRKSKLYYMRQRYGKKARIKEQREF